MELKSVAHPGGDGVGRVVYVVRLMRCMFCSVHPVPEDSQPLTEILAAICRAEGLPLDRLEFYELRTHRGYPQISVGAFSTFRVLPFLGGNRKGQVFATFEDSDGFSPVPDFAEFIGTATCTVV